MDRHRRTALQQAALEDIIHTTTARLAAGTRSNYRLSANDSTTLELVAWRGSVRFIMTLIQSGVNVHVVKHNGYSIRWT